VLPATAPARLCPLLPLSAPADTDESKRLEGIFVAVDDATGQFVATVRVFRRTLRTRANGAVAVGGFGEVSTLPAYRRRGLATALLRAALRWHENEGLWYSALHAASAAAGIYRSLGFAEVPTPIFFLELDADAAAETRLPGELEVSEPVRSSLEDIELFAEEAVAASVISEFSFEDDAAWSMAVTRLMPLQVALPAWCCCVASSLTCVACRRDSLPRLASSATRAASSTGRAGCGCRRRGSTPRASRPRAC